MKISSRKPSSKSKAKTVVGLEIDSNSVGAAELRVNGSTDLIRRAIEPIESGLFSDGEVIDPAALGERLKEVWATHKLPREVRLGLANQRIAVRTLRVPPLPEDELEAAVRFQAADQVPMPLEHSVLDWQVTGAVPEEQGGGLEVVAVAARRDMITGVVAALRTAGLRPVGIDHSAFAMIRALASETGPATTETSVIDPAFDPSTLSYEERIELERSGALPGQPETNGASSPERTVLYFHLGDVTNLAVATGTRCRFTRVAPASIEGIAQRLAEARELRLDHARQWLAYVGLDQPIDVLEGDPENVMAARAALDEGATRLAEEIRMSLDYYGAQDGAVMVDEVVACGPGIAIEGLVTRLERETGLAFRAATPAPMRDIDPYEAARLTVPFGLGLEE
ncbi:pilus assembly protein PilM [Thermoleophilia bacterium SCSIO 60948]|nr:pilus assembly protein PilM [Thermoleophilia bacterium SCSIO 60948]